jgi:hypothetical protein
VLGNNSLVEAVRFYVRRNPITLPRKTVREVADAFLADKQAKGKGDRYLSDLPSRCSKFANSFKCGIADITAAQIEKFLISLKSPRSPTSGIVSFPAACRPPDAARFAGMRRRSSELL